ncbi:hypothetical protein HELRODRAFT_178568 [Helobdella robusta]|uniref:Uncharacterized protein n=1 Tax=Helobdella robusta TaxID=6412 RepID=T1FDE3_HELRO|nr:hypothetical protein HELRODRAFT_178568 [Helobdella robusta]ESN97118.1 hypothetical protein HELRODRAFT_178568 [Helobdella robusta]
MRCGKMKSEFEEKLKRKHSFDYRVRSIAISARISTIRVPTKYAREVTVLKSRYQGKLIEKLCDNLLPPSRSCKESNVFAKHCPQDECEGQFCLKVVSQSSQGERVTKMCNTYLESTAGCGKLGKDSGICHFCYTDYCNGYRSIPFSFLLVIVVVVTSFLSHQSFNLHII